MIFKFAPTFTTRPSTTLHHAKKSNAGKLTLESRQIILSAELSNCANIVQS